MFTAQMLSRYNQSYILWPMDETSTAAYSKQFPSGTVLGKYSSFPVVQMQFMTPKIVC